MWVAAPAKMLLYFATKGHESGGLDFVSAAIERAKAKAAQRKIDAHLLVGNALELNKLGRQFDTVIDCGLFDTFSDQERPVFVQGLGEVLAVGADCCTFSVSRTRSRERKGRGELRNRKSETPSRNGWKVRRIEPTHFESVPTTGRAEVQPRWPEGMAGDD